MLFAAVTLGFFAENLREYQEEKNREIQFLQNIHFDLQRDLKEAQTAIDFNIQKQKIGDIVVEELASGNYVSILYLEKKLYETGYFKKTLQKCADAQLHSCSVLHFIYSACKLYYQLDFVSFSITTHFTNIRWSSRHKGEQ